MTEKYWIHVLPVKGGYLYKEWDRFDLGKKGDNEDDFTIAWTLDEIDELQKLPTFKNIKLRECLEPYEPTPKEIPDFCTVVFQGAEGDSWRVDYEVRNIFVYENGDIRYQGRDERTDTFGLYRIVKIWDDEKDFDKKIIEKIIKENRRRFAPDDKPIHAKF